MTDERQTWECAKCDKEHERPARAKNHYARAAFTIRCECGCFFACLPDGTTRDLGEAGI